MSLQLGVHGMPPAKRRVILRELATARGVTQRGLAKTLQKLHDRGLLTDALVRTPTPQQYERAIHAAVEDISEKVTPVGPVVQYISLPIDDGMAWPYIHPAAFLIYLTSVCASFYNLIADVVAHVGHDLNVLVYIDAVNPGNQLAPTANRDCECIYWTFKELPAWFLRRKCAWFTFGLLRSKLAKKIPGHISALMKTVLRVLFLSTHGLQNGCILQNGQRSLMITGRFGGFMADEKALKEIYDMKGQAGNIICLSCALTVRNRWVHTDGVGAIKFWEPEAGMMSTTTKEHIHEIVRRIKEDPDNESLQRQLGVNFNEDGIMFDDAFLDMTDPIRFYIRDWMHTLVSHGVVGTELALLCKHLQTLHVPLDVVQAYARQFHLPRCRGTVTDAFFEQGLMTPTHVRNWASDILTMMPLMYAFIVDKMQPRALAPEHGQCFILLYTIICILRKGEVSQAIHDRLNDVIWQHARAFLHIYDNRNCKIKFHHLYHLAADMLRIGRMLSCFTTERKHRDIKYRARTAWRDFERSVLVQYVNDAVHHFVSGTNDCLRCCLVGGMSVPDTNLRIAKAAQLPCGEVFANDMLFMTSGTVCKVIDFWASDDDPTALVVRAQQFQSVDGRPLHWRTDAPRDVVKSVDDIVEAIPWRVVDSRTILAVPPLF